MVPSPCIDCKTSPSPTGKALVGWVLESPGRGTLDLISTCILTIFLCTWVVIHVRVYKRSLFRRLHKIALFLKTILAPELIAVEALQEWSQSRRMVKNCAGLTGGGLKLVHAFYISMLALRYRTPKGAKAIWPNQYTWLLEQSITTWDEHELWGLSEGNIRDKSNADGAAKLLALCQVLWFVAQTIMRRAHSLPLAQLETMTLGYIPLYAVTYFFWWVKPKDVETPSLVDLPDMLPEQREIFESMAVSNTFDDEGIGKQNSMWNIWFLTPRVFEKEAEDKTRREAEEKALQESERKALLETQQPNTAPPQSKPPILHDVESGKNKKKKKPTWLCRLFRQPSRDVVVAIWDPELYQSKRLWPMICIFGASFGALHLISWNTAFPTILELWLWRAAALTSVFSMLVFMQYEKVLFRWGGLLTIISLVSPALYFVSRLLMIGGAIAAFRASDPRLYDTYVVSTYWVHIL